MQVLHTLTLPCACLLLCCVYCQGVAEAECRRAAEAAEAAYAAAFSEVRPRGVLPNRTCVLATCCYRNVLC